MSKRLTESKTVMHRVEEGGYTEEGMQLFTPFTKAEIEDDSEDSEDFDPADQKAIMVGDNVWEEMGKPDTITLTVQPGDHLNNDPTTYGDTVAGKRLR